MCASLYACMCGCVKRVTLVAFCIYMYMCTWLCVYLCVFIVCTYGSRKAVCVYVCKLSSHPFSLFLYIRVLCICLYVYDLYSLVYVVVNVLRACERRSVRSLVNARCICVCTL